jgi:hypothetical protein
VLDLGASIVHSHNEEPMFTSDGMHPVEPYLASWRSVLERQPDLLMYRRWRPTRGASRWSGGGHVEELAPRRIGGMTLIDPGGARLGLGG